MSGRTTWWAKDAAWHRRERIVELGEEHGPAGPGVMDVLSAWAQEQRAGGLVVGGFRTLAREAFVTASDARSIMEHATRIGALDDLDLDADHRRFTVRVSGWTSDADRGRAAIRMANMRANEGDSEDLGQNHLPEPTVTSDDELRPVTPSALPDQTKETKTPLPPKGGRRRDQQAFDVECQAHAKRLGIEGEDGWINVKAAFQQGAVDDVGVFAYLERWRPDLLPESVAA